MSDVTLLRISTRPILRVERVVDLPLETAWQKATNLDEMTSWFPTRIELSEWKVGADLTHYFDEHSIDPLPGTVLHWEPPFKAEFTWGNDAIVFTLSNHDTDRSFFVLLEELDKQHAARNAAGWESCLDRYQYGSEQAEWTDRFSHYEEAFTPVLGKQVGPSVGH